MEAKLRYVCPVCKKEITVYPQKEVSRTTEKVYYQCTCPHCHAGCEVSIENDGKIKTMEEEAVFDLEFGKKNEYELCMN